MTLKEKLLESLEQERKAIDAAIFLIQSSKALDAISLGGEVGRDVATRPAPRRPERASPTPPPSDDTEED